MRKIISKLFGDPNVKAVKKLQPLVDAINSFEPELKKKSEPALKKQSSKFKAALEDGKNLDDILPEAFATVREAARRKLGQRHFDVQLMGGIVLHQAKITEMRTGEGKTLVATLPVYLNALAGKGVHIITVNDFLAQRDAGWMAPIYHALGLSVGVIISGRRALIYDPEYINEEHQDERLRHLKPVEKTQSYSADITYGTNNEFGFDYLRDNMASRIEDLAQRPLHYAIIDEVDSLLIDEARTPLIISAPASESAVDYQEFSKLARTLTRETDYLVDEKAQAATLTDDGVAKVEKFLGVSNLYDPEHVRLIYHLEQALRAEALFKLDKDYVVKDGEVIIVDEFTGRLLPGRRYSEGLHQAIEAKEGVNVLAESVTLATISFQNYYRLYAKLAGMTGTAMTEAEEFQTVYNLDVVAIPTNKPMVRADLRDRIYKTETAKLTAIVEDIKTRNKKGQPVLLGTVSIEKNELLSKLLNKAKIKHEVLNAKNHEREASIVEAAGQKGAVTLATNIAGRGTDIVLGQGVAKLGGLHVLGSERHEARRIDNQLRGRAGRQGDAGSSQFYVSLEDDLMRVFGGERIAGLMTTLRVDETVPIENAMVSKAIESAQKRIENHNFDIRKNVLQYDDVMNRHRGSIYTRRRQVLESQNLKAEITEMIEREIEFLISSHTDVKNEKLDKAKAIELAKNLLALPDRTAVKLAKLSDNKLKTAILKEAKATYKSREKQFGAETIRAIERAVYLQVLDRYWMEHLETMQHLREGIRWRAVGQRDPLAEYKKEAFSLFNALNANIDREVAQTIFRIAPVAEASTEAPVKTELTQAAESATAQTEDPTEKPKRSQTQTVRKTKNIGRNDPCPCGSGLKYKKCGLINAPEHKGG